MKFKKQSSPIFFLFAAIIVFAFSTCHLHGRPEQPTIDSVTHPESGYCGSWMLPKTGQTREFMAADDGDLRVGRRWSKPRFMENRDGTVTDHVTGLIWTQNANKANGTTDWEQAVLGAGACTDGGFIDWRLPNRNELESLIDLGKYNPALPADHPFTGVQPSYYWTSSTPANNDDQAWVVHFYLGFVTHDDKAGSHYVWYVR